MEMDTTEAVMAETEETTEVVEQPPTETEPQEDSKITEEVILEKTGQKTLAEVVSLE